MTPLRVEDITLYCEDKGGGRSQRMLEAALDALRDQLSFAQTVRPIGVSSKSDVQVRTRFARTQTGPHLRVFGVRDRDFLPSALVAEARAHAFNSDAQRVSPWPLPRHSIESYLLDEDVLTGAATPIARAEIEAAAGARRWLDVARGTLERLAYDLRKIRHDTPQTRPADRAEALRAVLDAAEQMQHKLEDAIAEKGLAGYIDEIAADMVADGPLWCRVDGRELVYDLEPALGLARGTLLDRLARHARLRPPAALVADLRTALEAMPAHWRTGA